MCLLSSLWPFSIHIKELCLFLDFGAEDAAVHCHSPKPPVPVASTDLRTSRTVLGIDRGGAFEGFDEAKLRGALQEAWPGDWQRSRSD